MRKKLAVLAPLLALVALAIPAAAQAVPHWYQGKVLLGSAPVPIATAGALQFEALGTTVKCKVTDTEEIWNPASGGPGEDLMTGFTLTKCKSSGSSACPKGAIEMIANGLPWPSVLVTVSTTPLVIRDEIKKVRILMRCLPGTVGDEFEGTLSPEVVGSSLVFGPSAGNLLDSSSNPMVVYGKDKLSNKTKAKDP